jgi:hypothetical protein
MRVRIANAFLERRATTEILAVAVILAAFLLATRDSDFDSTLSAAMRADLYDPLSGATGTLLGFVLAALAILVALPSTERIQKLQEHPDWKLIPSTYFRAARALLAALVLCLLGLPLDSGKDPWVLYEAFVVVALSLSLVRVAAGLIALDQILAVARTDQTSREGAQMKPIDDPGA